MEGSVLYAILAVLFPPHLLIYGGKHELEHQRRHERAFRKVLEEGIVLRILWSALRWLEAAFAVGCNKVLDDCRAGDERGSAAGMGRVVTECRRSRSPPLAHDDLAITQGRQVARRQCSRQACSDTSRYHCIDAVRALFLLALSFRLCLCIAGRAQSAKGGSPQCIALGEAGAVRLCAYRHVQRSRKGSVLLVHEPRQTPAGPMETSRRTRFPKLYDRPSSSRSHQTGRARGWSKCFAMQKRR